MSMKLLCLYLVQHLLHQIKAQQFYTDLDLYEQCKILQKTEEFKDFSRPLNDFPVLFKADLIFKDFSRKPSKFKYFSSLCKPCIYIWIVQSLWQVVTFVICWKPFQTVWNQIRTDRMSVLIWILTVWHSNSVHERIFSKKLILKKVSRRQQKHERLPSIQRGKDTNLLS